MRERFYRSIRLAIEAIVKTLRCGAAKVVTVMGSGQPADYRDDDLDLIDDDDPEPDLLDDPDERVAD